MFLSTFELFKIGIGPSSSHTVGPMLAAGQFLSSLKQQDLWAAPGKLQVTLYGSLAFTGQGHGTAPAVVLGLLGEHPETINPDDIEGMIKTVRDSGKLVLRDKGEIVFDMEQDIVFDYGPALAKHANGMRFKAFDEAGHEIATQDYYSIGGGFVVRCEDFEKAQTPVPVDDIPYGFRNADEMLAMGQQAGKSLAEMKLANEMVVYSEAEVFNKLDEIWQAMNGCIERGLKQSGILPGGLAVKRRASAIHQELKQDPGRNFKFEHTCMDWISLYALAVNEENAAGGRVVTAPTNGAAGIIPATLRYSLDHCPGAKDDAVHKFLLTAAAIGVLIKSNASISGAEVGCQGEVGSASAMAAAGLAAVLDGSNEQIENAAEIALEHHLGMTCDPVGGLVQVPCIERNAMGAVKAVNAASLALKGDGSHFISLDAAIETMRQTGLDMHTKYKETSQGGLAVSGVEC